MQLQVVKSARESHDMILIACGFKALIHQCLYALPGLFGSCVLGVKFHDCQFYMGWHLSA
jgi:hypothetical protein